MLLYHTVNSRTHIHIHATKGTLKPAHYHTAMKEQYFVANKISYKTHVIWELIIINIKDWTSLIRSVSRVTTVLANVSSVFQLFSFLVVCSGRISTGFGFVAFFANVNASSVCIHLSCLVCL